MKLQQERPVGQNLVTARGDGYVDVNGVRYQRSLLLLADRIESDWGVAGFAGLTETDFASIAATGCEVLLFGTGQHQRFPPPALLRPLMQARIGVEVMDTAAACRTYNILIAEDRKVAAALLLD